MFVLATSIISRLLKWPWARGLPRPRPLCSWTLFSPCSWQRLLHSTSPLRTYMRYIDDVLGDLDSWTRNTTPFFFIVNLYKIQFNLWNISFKACNIHKNQSKIQLKHFKIEIKTCEVHFKTYAIQFKLFKILFKPAINYFLRNMRTIWRLGVHYTTDK